MYKVFKSIHESINIQCCYNRQVSQYSLLKAHFLYFSLTYSLNFRAAIFQKVADLIAGKYRIQSLAATMVGQVSVCNFDWQSGLKTDFKKISDSKSGVPEDIHSSPKPSGNFNKLCAFFF